MEFVPYDPDRITEISRRNLPHWHQKGATSYVTFRLADSIPPAKLSQWKEERRIWIEAQTDSNPNSWPDEKKAEYRERFLNRIEKWAERGYGNCDLRDAEIRKIVENALRFFDRSEAEDYGSEEGIEERYVLDEFVIMPNHLHLLVQPLAGFTLQSILHSWKSFTAHRASKHLGRQGTWWMDERFDHLVRSREQLDKFRSYIRQNPGKAGLSSGTFTLGCGIGIQ